MGTLRSGSASCPRVILLNAHAHWAAAPGHCEDKADNTRRACTAAKRHFQAWAATPLAVDPYSGHLAAADRSMSSIEQARADISRFHAAIDGTQASTTTPDPPKETNPRELLLEF